VAQYDALERKLIASPRAAASPIAPVAAAPLPPLSVLRTELARQETGLSASADTTQDDGAAALDSNDPNLRKWKNVASMRPYSATALGDLDNIAPAAGGDGGAFLDQIMSHHRKPGTGGGTVIAPASSDPRITLTSLLLNAGVQPKNMMIAEQSVSGFVSQWAAGRVSGMYELMPPEGDFNRQVSAYIDRYRGDCGERLDIHMTGVESLRVGTLAMADIECAMPANAYASSFIFLRDGAGFSVFLHTAHPKARAEARLIRDGLLRGLRAASGFAAPHVVMKVQAPAESPLRFNVKAAPDDTQTPVDADDIETLVIR